jgi:hypothetical protein
MIRTATHDQDILERRALSTVDPARLAKSPKNELNFCGKALATLDQDEQPIRTAEI